MWPFSVKGKLKLRKTLKLRAGRRVINAWQHQGWGNAVDIYDWEGGRIGGHLREIPKVGDYVIFAHKDGANAIVTQIVDLDRAGDPPDMWFANIKKLYAMPLSEVPEEPKPEPSRLPRFV